MFFSVKMKIKEDKKIKKLLKKWLHPQKISVFSVFDAQDTEDLPTPLLPPQMGSYPTIWKPFGGGGSKGSIQKWIFQKLLT